MSTYDNSAVSAIYSSTYDSLHDFDLPYQVRDELYQRYGKGQLMTDWLRRMGAEFTFTNNLPLNAHEEGWAEETFTTTGASTSTGAAGAPIFVTVDPSCVDSEGNIRPRLYETVYYKHTDNKVYQLFIYAITTTSVSVSGSAVDTYQLSLKPLDVTLTSASIADGTELTLGGTKFAEYTKHPASTAKGMYRRQFYSQISKEKQTVTGTELGTAHYYTQLKNGYKSVWSKLYAEKEFLLDKQMDYDFLLGQLNTNNVTMADKDGVSRAVKSTKGVWKWFDELAGKLTYGTSDFDFFTMDDVPTYMRSQGVFTKNFMFGNGPDLYTKLENGGLEFIKDYSSTDLSRYFGSEGVGSDVRNAALGMTFNVFEKGGLKFMLTPIDTFGNVKGLGNATYDFSKAGMIIPLGNKSKVDGLGEIDNLAIGYNVSGEVNRKRVIKTIAGPVGNSMAAAQEWDGIDLLMLTDFMAFVMKANQCMQVLPYASY